MPIPSIPPIVSVPNGTLPPRAQPVVCVIGNSIANICKVQNPGVNQYFNTGNETLCAAQLAGAPWQWKIMTASTRADRFCTYGYSGQTLPTILGDLQAQLFTPMQTADIVPGVVIAHALLENDISGGATYAACVLSITQYLRDVTLRWPGATHLIYTPRPSFSNDTAGKVLVWQQISDYIMSLGNGFSIFCARLNSYEDAAAPALPKTGTIAGYTVGTTFTCTTADAANPIEIGHYIRTPGANTLTALTRISGRGTGTGGTGTYTINNSQTFASSGSPGALQLCTYTDDTVHPNQRGAMSNARQQAVAIRKMSKTWRAVHAVASTNMSLGGSGAASGTQVSGTVPTSVTIAGSSNATIVALAEQPGLLLTYSGVASGSGAVVADLSSVNFGALSLVAANFNSRMQIEVVSGAANIQSIQLATRMADGSGNPFKYGMQNQTNDIWSEYQNGDILDIEIPTQEAVTAPISTATVYLRVVPRYDQTVAGGGAFAIRVRTQGVGYLPQVVDEFITATVAAGSPVSLDGTTPATSNITSISLTPGEWDISSQVEFILTGASSTNFKIGPSLTSATLPTQAGGTVGSGTLGTDALFSSLSALITTSGTMSAAGRTVRVVNTATVTLYLTAQATFSVGTVTAYGSISARRVAAV